ncbi:MAG: hypothetical protein JF588_06520 [Caulobacterales bacterium]|nr:hypothetical protein [Caulobacterales bacterium]
MAHHPHRHYPHPPPCYGGEALAVVAEALALERETIAETARLVGYLDGVAGRWNDPAAEYERLREAAANVAELSWALQRPAWDNPYAGLAADISALARQILEEMRAFDHRDSAPGGDPAPDPDPEA